jgi:hypothetical protein
MVKKTGITDAKKDVKSETGRQRTTASHKMIAVGELNRNKPAFNRNKKTGVAAWNRTRPDHPTLSLSTGQDRTRTSR